MKYPMCMSVRVYESACVDVRLYSFVLIMFGKVIETNM